MTYFMGIDGGGSTVRVAITSSDMTVIHQSEGLTVNPSVVGHEMASERVQTAIREAMMGANIRIDDVKVCGVGIAGASVAHSEAWLRQTLTTVLPDVPLALASDVEIALIGANGKRYGVLLLVGTGSVALGIDAKGDSLQVGGWGYILGDEGGGYWIGLQALKCVVEGEENNAYTPFQALILDFLNLRTARALISFVYEDKGIPVREIAKLAPIVVSLAHQSKEAQHIIEEAVTHLATCVNRVRQRLHLPDDAPLGFSGGLLTQENALTRGLCQALGLPVLPIPCYSPVIGASLLAKQFVLHKDKPT